MKRNSQHYVEQAAPLTLTLTLTLTVALTLTLTLTLTLRGAGCGPRRGGAAHRDARGNLGGRARI